MAPNHIEEIRAALEHLNQCSPPDQPVLDESDSWLAPDLLEMLMATVRTDLDGQEVVSLGVMRVDTDGRVAVPDSPFELT